MMVGVPVLFVVWVVACPPFTCVMAVGVGVSWWCVFQCRVAVVWASSCVPGVCVCSGVFLLVWAFCGVCVWFCVGVGVWSCVGVLFSGVWWLGAGVCVWWFRMLMCVRLSCFWFCFLVCFVWLITGCLGFRGRGRVVFVVGGVGFA